MADDLDNFISTSTNYYDDIPVKEQTKLKYMDPQTGALHRVTVSYNWNEDVEDAIENKLLRSPEYSTWESKLEILEPLYSVQLEAVTQFFPTVTGLEFKTEHDGQVKWTRFENASELPKLVPLEEITTDLPKVSVTELSNFSYLFSYAYSVHYRDERHVLKYHGNPMQNGAFRAELTAQLAIGDIPHFQRITAIVTKENPVDKKLHIVGMLMKFCEKGDLQNLLSHREKDVSWDRKTKWAAQITHGLMGIHEAGIVHGDMRCGNVVVDENDDAHIIDIIQDEGFAEEWMCNMDDRRDLRRDVYSLGATFWEMGFNGKKPVYPLKPLGMETFDQLVRLSVLEEGSERASLDQIFDILGGKATCGCCTGE